MTSTITKSTCRNPRRVEPFGRRVAKLRARRSVAERSKSCQDRILRAARVRELPLDYMPSKEFTEPNMAETILGPVPEPAVTARKARRPNGLPSYLASLYDVPLLAAEQERHLFRKYNFLKYLASTLREELDPVRPKTWLLDKIEKLFAQAVETKNQIIRANLRLVVSIVKKYARRQDQFFEIISEGNVSLMKAVEKFDYTRGFKFSTYATWAIHKNHAREYVSEVRYLDRFRTTPEEGFDWAADQRSNQFEQERLQAQREAQVEKILGCLTEREREIIVKRYGLTGSFEGQTLKAVGSDLGVSKERIRQLEGRALAKLRDAAAEAKIEAL